MNIRHPKSYNAFVSWSLVSLLGCQGGDEGQTDRPEEKNQATRPNIIFIMADDLGYADLGCYGQELIKTPYIDQMAAEGMRFTQAYSGSTVSAPSRSVLMTGQHTGHTSVRGNMCHFGGTPVWDHGPLQKRPFLLPGDTTIAEMLNEAGYVTGATGKWGLGENQSSGAPNLQGFDQWFGYLNQRRAHTYYPPYLWLNGQKVEYPKNPEEKHTYSHGLITEFALGFIRENKDKPFFLYLPYCLPHDEYEIPSAEPYDKHGWDEAQTNYAAMVSLLDEDVGAILKQLKELQIDGNTIVFFCSDNGAALRFDELFRSSGPLRGRKRDMYEGGLRVPMIVRWPGKIPAGTQSSFIWYFPDLMPTLAELTGANCPQTDGISVLKALKDENLSSPGRMLYWEFHEGSFKQAVRWKNWKAVKNGLDAEWELYDLHTDIGETQNIAAEKPEILGKMETFAEQEHTESPYWPVELYLEHQKKYGK